MESSSGKTGYQFPFERLNVYSQAKQLVLMVYESTKRFPAKEQFGMTSQLCRAAISVASNIAEGCGRLSRPEQAHFSQIAYGSLMEVLCQCDISRDLGFISEANFSAIRAQAERVARMLNSLHATQVLKKERQ